MVTTDQLKSIYTSTPSSTLQTYVGPINDTFNKYLIITKLRQAMFLAQIGHESAGLTAVSENLNYSAAALQSVFGKYFDATSAAQYARQPERIANRVYANRMGNGSESSGDGWKYRGRGGIQITGRANYSAMATTFGMSIDDVVAYLQTPAGVVASAGWFWSTHNLNVYSDRGDIVSATKVINGGTNGLSDRQALYTKALKVL